MSLIGTVQELFTEEINNHRVENRVAVITANELKQAVCLDIGMSVDTMDLFGRVNSRSANMMLDDNSHTNDSKQDNNRQSARIRVEYYGQREVHRLHQDSHSTVCWTFDRYCNYH